MAPLPELRALHIKIIVTSHGETNQNIGLQAIYLTLSLSPSDLVYNRVGYLAKCAEVAILWVHLSIHGCSRALYHLDLSDAKVTEDTHKHMHTLTHTHSHTVFMQDICVYIIVMCSASVLVYMLDTMSCIDMC